MTANSMLEWLADQSNNPLVLLISVSSSVATLVVFFGDKMLVILSGGSLSNVPPGGHIRMALGSLAAFVMVSTTFLFVVGKVSQTIPLPPPPRPPISTTASDLGPEALADAAYRLGAKHQYREALSMYQIIERISPSFPLLHLDMAYCARELGDLQAALGYAEDAVREAIASGPQVAGNALYNLACVRFAADDKKGALESLDQAVIAGFPFQCNVANSDPDLLAMGKDPAFQADVQRILADGTRDCSAGK